jgi:TfoX/Sxy family transcriptional regulator of competence genes
MAYDEQLANRIRQRFEDLPNVEEKEMMGGMCLMYNDKMCVGIMKNELMCRIDPGEIPQALERPECRMMEMAGRVMNGYVLVDNARTMSQKDFDYWIDLSLAFNPKAKSSKKKK